MSDTAQSEGVTSDTPISKFLPAPKLVFNEKMNMENMEHAYIQKVQ